MNVKPVSIIYHGNCYDGITAAWICWTKFEDKADYISLNYSDEPPNVIGKEVYVVDFSFKRDILEKMRLDAESLVILDHHKTAQDDLKNFPGAIFDMNRSGAGIAWDFFYPTKERPDLVNYVEDRDLWRFKLPNSKEITAWIQSFDIDLYTWINEVAYLDVENAYKEGKSLLRQQNKLVKSIAFNARLRKINEYIAPYVQTSILMSEVCDQMLKDYPDYPFSFYSFQRKDGKFQYGMRSRPDFDVSIIAKQFGGGGHKQAAGFELDKELIETDKDFNAQNK